MQKNGYQKYAKIKRETASPLSQVAILLDHGAHLMSQAHTALLENRIEERFIAIDKTLALLNGLMSVLEPHPSSHSQPLVQTMTRFYTQMFQLLFQINSKQDALLCQKAITYLKDMAQVWRDVDKEGSTSSSLPITPGQDLSLLS